MSKRLPEHGDTRSAPRATWLTRADIPKGMGRCGASLEWYFGPGAASLERSTMGGQLDHCELFGSGQVPCPECGTRGSIKQGGVYVTCPKCNGVGWRSRTIQDWAKLSLERGVPCETCGGRKPAVVDCPDCHGSGLTHFTALPTGHEVQDHGFEPWGERFSVLSSVSRAVRAVERQRLVWGLALACFWGPSGDRWELTRMSRLHPVRALTAPGKSVLYEQTQRMAKSKADDGSSDALLAQAFELKRHASAYLEATALAAELMSGAMFAFEQEFTLET